MTLDYATILITAVPSRGGADGCWVTRTRVGPQLAYEQYATPMLHDLCRWPSLVIEVECSKLIGNQIHEWLDAGTRVVLVIRRGRIHHTHRWWRRPLTTGSLSLPS
jgi:hypothetical protein